ncbi:hypothetical protein HanLR1_Chr05g0193491 [Helianthus annuus]|nr:hypothetical protein HanLR1_Chr05g0193491 [Helianthus annuus]
MIGCWFSVFEPGVFLEAASLPPRDRGKGVIGAYWSLRAALGPVLETLILLDRLLFLQEQGDSVEAVMVPIFNPNISPRNIALIAKKI